MKVSALIGEQLDYWVARADGWEHVDSLTLRKVDGEGLGAIVTTLTVSRHSDYGSDGRKAIFYSPSTNWGSAGPVIERGRISLEPVPAGTVFMGEPLPAPGWLASTPGSSTNECAASPLVAAMRAYVASKFGREVPDA